ncbi:hypothetical protein V2J09_009489 [Rumex salicifolius]
MGFSVDRLFNRTTSVHQILGGGIVADVILWRQRNVTIGLLLLVISIWLVFERSGYTLLSLCSSVLLLLFSILFIWAKAAALLNRPAPPLPDMWISEEQANEMATLIRGHVNSVLSASQSIALGKDSRLYCKSAGWLLLISVVSAWADLVTLGYACIIILLTVPAIYERYEEQVDHCVISINRSLLRLCAKLDEQIAVMRNWDLEKLKLD